MVFCVFSIVFAPYATTFIDRIALYFIAFQIIVYSRIPVFFQNKTIYLSYIYSLMISYITLFFIWFIFSPSAYAWKPYRINLFKVEQEFYVDSWIIDDDFLNPNSASLAVAIESLEKFKEDRKGIVVKDFYWPPN